MSGGSIRLLFERQLISTRLTTSITAFRNNSDTPMCQNPSTPRPSHARDHNFDAYLGLTARRFSKPIRQQDVSTYPSHRFKQQSYSHQFMGLGTGKGTTGKRDKFRLVTTFYGKILVRVKGLEPPRQRRQNLNLVRLRIPPHPHLTAT